MIVSISEFERGYISHLKPRLWDHGWECINKDGIFTKKTVQQCYEDSMETLKMP